MFFLAASELAILVTDLDGRSPVRCWQYLCNAKAILGTNMPQASALF